MFLRKSVPATHQRVIVLSIKTTHAHEYKPEAGDRLTQIACMEMLNGEITNKKFVRFLNPNSPELTAHYQQSLATAVANKKLAQKEADILLHHFNRAPSLQTIQNELLAFLAAEANTTILVHYKKHVLNFLRFELNDEGKATLAKLEENMVDMISLAAQLAKRGLYFAGRYPERLVSGKETLSDERTFYQFDQICSELKVHVRRRTGFSAEQDALLLAQAEHNRLNLIANNPSPTLRQRSATL